MGLRSWWRAMMSPHPRGRGDVLDALSAGMPGRGYCRVASLVINGEADHRYTWADSYGGVVLSWPPQCDGSVEVVHLWRGRERARFMLRGRAHVAMFLDTL